MPVWIPGVDVTQDYLPENKFLKVVYKQECPVQVICSRDDVEAVLI